MDEQVSSSTQSALRRRTSSSFKAHGNSHSTQNKHRRTAFYGTSRDLNKGTLDEFEMFQVKEISRYSNMYISSDPATIYTTGQQHRYIQWWSINTRKRKGKTSTSKKTFGQKPKTYTFAIGHNPKNIKRRVCRIFARKVGTPKQEKQKKKYTFGPCKIYAKFAEYLQGKV